MAEPIYLTTYVDQRTAEQWQEKGSKLFEQIEQSFDRLPVEIRRTLLWNFRPRGLDDEKREKLTAWLMERTPLCQYSPLGSTLWRALHALGHRLPGNATVIYFDCRNGQVNSPDWAADLIGAVGEYAGCVHWSDYRILGINRNELHDTLWQAVDPGMFKVTADLLKKIPPHPGLTDWYGETWFSYRIQRMGLPLTDVPSIRCVRRGKLKNPERFSYVCDEREPALSG